MYDIKLFEKNLQNNLEDLKNLDKITSQIKESNLKERLNEGNYLYLKNVVSLLYQFIFSKEIDLFNRFSKKDKEKQLVEIKDAISITCSKEKLNELHYTLLKEKITNYEK